MDTITKPVGIDTDDLEQYLGYLDALRESGVTNMFGAGLYLTQEFNLTSKESHAVLAYWMQTFSDRHTEEGDSKMHTPGPWTVDNERKHLVFAKDGKWTTENILVAHAIPGFEEDQEFANARLIAAAPDLLEALQAARDLMSTEDVPRYLRNWAMGLEKLIAKAEGKS